eukprot:XP_001708537.1 Hypothetical protein GL50803_35752 [Giardia lamblia ATCC 50803]
MIPVELSYVQLLLALKVVLAQCLYFTRKDGLRLQRRVDRACLDRYQHASIGLQIVPRILCDNPCLVRLCHIRKDAIDLRDYHTILVRMPCVSNDGVNVRSSLSNLK